MSDDAPGDGQRGDATDRSAPRHSGRLGLTWANQEKALLARDDGSYEWVAKHDHRVAEVRLLQDAGTVGEVASEEQRAADNLLVRGDALHVLTALRGSPEFARQYAGAVKCVYLDPPFNTGQAFAQYDDGLEHSVWLTMMRDRLEQVRDLLAPDGSVWVHLDDAEMAYCRVMMDDIFGRENFIATFIWQKADTLRNDATRASVSHDYILAFASDIGEFTMNRLPRTDEMDSVYKNPDDDPRGPWLPSSLISPAYRRAGDFVITGPTGREHRAPEGTSWRTPEATFDQLLADNRIWFGKRGEGVPQRKMFLTEVGGRAVDTIWSVKDVGGNRQSKAEIKALFPEVVPFATPKPERLIERVIRIATDPGDVVLDCFGGSGTTAAVAHKMGRRWVTSEVSRKTVDTFTAPRLERVVTGADLGGITSEAAWTGGGGFRVLDVGPSMYADDFGVVVLNDWAHNGQLGRAVAAQLGYAWEPDGPFCGRRGRMRLAVIDGHVDTSVVGILVNSLPVGERLSLASTSLDPEASTSLGKLCPGSQARVVPHDLLLAYRTPSAWRASVARDDEPPVEVAAGAADGVSDD